MEAKCKSLRKEILGLFSLTRVLGESAEATIEQRLHSLLVTNGLVSIPNDYKVNMETCDIYFHNHNVLYDVKNDIIYHNIPVKNMNFARCIMLGNNGLEMLEHIVGKYTYSMSELLKVLTIISPEIIYVPEETGITAEVNYIGFNKSNNTFYMLFNEPKKTPLAYAIKFTTKAKLLKMKKTVSTSTLSSYDDYISYIRGEDGYLVAQRREELKGTLLNDSLCVAKIERVKFESYGTVSYTARTERVLTDIYTKYPDIIDVYVSNFYRDRKDIEQIRDKVLGKK